MPRVMVDAALTTRNARAKLKPRSKPYWRRLDTEAHLGYRKAAKGGHWVVRWHGGSKYLQVTLEAADDEMPANGKTHLDFAQAERAARAVIVKHGEQAKAEARGPAPTVRSAVETYIGKRNIKEDGQGSVKRDAKSRLTKHVLSQPIGVKFLHELETSDLTGWRAGARKRLAASSVTRLSNDLKAALNDAALANRAGLPNLPAAIKDGLRAEDDAPAGVPRQEVLPDADIRLILQSAWQVDGAEEWGGDLARLCVTLAATGARFSQVVRMHAAHVQADVGRLMVPTSRKGRGKKAAQLTAVRVGADVIEALKPIIAGRRGSEFLFERWRHVQTGPNTWTRDKRGPWRNASELAKPWKSIVATAKLDPAPVPYAFRHSSIVRGLRAGLPVRLVASLHDTSTAMIERHYAAFIIDAMDELAARAVVPLTTAPATLIQMSRRNDSAG
jgi:integrase